MSPSKIKIPRIPLAPRNDIDVNINQEEIGSRKLSNACNVIDKKKSDSAVQSFHKDSRQNFKNRLARKISFKNDKIVGQEAEKIVANSPPVCHIMKRVLTTKEIKDTWWTVYLQE